MRGNGFLLLSLVSLGVAIALYHVRPLLDRLLRRLDADITKLRPEADPASSPMDTHPGDGHLLRPHENEDAVSIDETVRSVLRPGETEEDFIEAAVRHRVRQRRAEANLIAKALTASAEHARSGVTHSADDVHAELKQKLDRAKRRIQPSALRDDLDNAGRL